MRDIVEFVPFARDMMLGNLSEDVLRKVPLEFCTYMEKVGYIPNKPTQQIPVISAVQMPPIGGFLN